MKPTVGLVIGDPCGVGPELAAKLLSRQEALSAANILVVGDIRVFRMGEEVADLSVPVCVVEDITDARFEANEPVLLNVPAADPATFTIGEVSAAAGASVLQNFTRALHLARDGHIDAICFTPFNKQALHMAGNRFADELHFAAHELGYDGQHSEFNVLEEIWNARVTSHVPLRDVADLITTDRIVDGIRLTDRAMRGAGFNPPRIAVAALNPHAGDGGLFGREEIDVIGPAVHRAKADGVQVDGPFPSDTVYLRARDGHYDAVLSMYHDQGQIAMKLMGFDRGITVLGGLPVPITTPAHGTAFDIAGQGKANPEAARRALAMATRMGAEAAARRAAA